MDDYLLIDGHNDLPWAHRQGYGYDLGRADVARPQPALHTDLPRLRRGGVKGQFWSVYVPSTLTGPEAVAAVLEQIDFVHRLVARYDDELGLATSADEVEAVVAGGRVASLLGAEGGHCIADSLGVLRMLHRLGVRYLTLTHNHNTSWADSATDVPAACGLTEFGRAVVAEMNRIGMVVDLSHVAPSTMRAALDTGRAPVIFSHSNARALCDVPRNVPDDVLETMAARGGVCMATFVPGFVSQRTADWHQRCRDIAAERGLDPKDLVALGRVVEERAAADPPPRSTVEDVVAQLEHLRAVAGVDHLGIGGDFDGTDLVTSGLEDVATYPRLFAALRDRSWSAADLDKLAGRNVLRVLRDVESVAAA
ncbi:dipeptidase [Jiangella anatolica]|uniref:Membrane dipeptidase n=1 Tax=Jiangella anatolica TaxID=2670374 RepID=A0A2W2CER2_9ACTN|nr:dipeptidase [Jiangella anatolica]PZF86739.1 membrane dipeptidase [Jiangella anatolica]